MPILTGKLSTRWRTQLIGNESAHWIIDIALGSLHSLENTVDWKPRSRSANWTEPFSRPYKENSVDCNHNEEHAREFTVDGKLISAIALDSCVSSLHSLENTVDWKRGDSCLLLCFYFLSPLAGEHS